MPLPASRLPEFGPRGEGWVVLQLLLGAARAFLRQQAATTMACDFLTVETAFLQRIYDVACSANPDGAWTAQQARNLMMQLGDDRPCRLLIHDTVTRSSAAGSTRSSVPSASG